MPFVTRWINSVFAALWLLSAPAQAQQIELTLDQARQVAVAALHDGQPAVTLEIAQALLLAEPRDAEVHFLIARAYQAQANPDAGRLAAVAAFRMASDPLLKFRAAQLAARLAVEGEKPVLAQIWLRRAANHVPNDQEQALLARDFATLRLISPWSLRGALATAPSNNVNNGASNPENTIDGVSSVGVLSSDALALSGVKASGYAEAAYRLDRTEASETRAVVRLDLSRVWLSADALAASPTSDNGDFAYTAVDVGVSHRRQLGNGRDVLSLAGGAAHAWYAGADYRDSTRFSASLSRPLDEGAALTATLSGLNSRPVGSAAITTTAAQLAYSQPTDAGPITIGAQVQNHATVNDNARLQKALVYGGFTPDLADDRYSLALNAGFALSHYPDYRVGFIAVPGGRLDQTTFVTADLTFNTLDYWGFVPNLKLSAQKSLSNVSRFETEELSLAFGVVSRF